jgi:hypothetical protein
MPFDNDPPQNTNTDMMVSMKKAHWFLANNQKNLWKNTVIRTYHVLDIIIGHCREMLSSNVISQRYIWNIPLAANMTFGTCMQPLVECMYRLSYKGWGDISFIARGMISQLSRRAQRARDNCDIVQRALKLISPNPEYDNLFIIYLYLYQG